MMGGGKGGKKALSIQCMKGKNTPSSTSFLSLSGSMWEAAAEEESLPSPPPPHPNYG